MTDRHFLPDDYYVFGQYSHQVIIVLHILIALHSHSHTFSSLVAASKNRKARRSCARAHKQNERKNKKKQRCDCAAATYQNQAQRNTVDKYSRRQQARTANEAKIPREKSRRRASNYSAAREGKKWR